MKNNQVSKTKAGKVTEFTVKIRIKPERLEWLSCMSDRLGLTRDQAISGMLESHMEADENGISIEHAQEFTTAAAVILFPERKALRVLLNAFRVGNASEQRIAEAKGHALIELHDIAPMEMGLKALHQTKAALIRQGIKEQQAGKAVKS